MIMKIKKMKKYLTVSMAVLMTMMLIITQALTVYAEDAAESETYGETEEWTASVSDESEEWAESVTDETEEELTAYETDAEDGESTSDGMISGNEPGHEDGEDQNQPIDEWIYEVLKQATPAQIELIEDIVLGGLNALDKLEIKGFDRVRIWVEHNMATVMVAALTVALIAFMVSCLIQKRGFAKKAEILNANAIEIFEAGQEHLEKLTEACKEYADMADKICKECADAAKSAARSAHAANGQVTEERAMLIQELAYNARVNKALCEEINFLMQCSDLSQPKRDEAEMIFRKSLEVIDHDGSEEL